MKVILGAFLLLAACGATSDYTRTTTRTGHVINAPYTFAVLGDVPYTTKEMDHRDEWTKFDHLIGELAQRRLAFVVHVGDIEDGNQGNSCPRTQLENVRTEFGRLTNAGIPWFYAPGDNEWIDCDVGGQTNAADARPLDVYDKLADIRSLFFNGWGSLQNFHTISNWTTQGDPIENQMWQAPGVTFATLGLVSWGGDFRKAHGSDVRYVGEFTHRGMQARRWVEAATEVSEAVHNKLIIVFAQAGLPKCRNEIVSCLHSDDDDNITPGLSPSQSSGGFFDDWNAAAKGNAYTRHNYLYVHGDYHCFHGPQAMFRGDPQGSPNLYGLQVNGSPDVEALLITVPAGVGAPEQLQIQRLQCTDKNGPCKVVPIDALGKCPRPYRRS